MGRKLTDEQEQEIVRRYLAGESGYRLGETLGVTANTVGRFLKRNGIATRSIKEAKGGLTDEKESEACALYQEGQTFNFLAEMFGINRSTVRSILRRNGITIRTVTESRCGLTYELEAEVGRRYLAGENTTQLGAAFGVTPTCISAVLKRNGAATRSPQETMGGLNIDQEAEVCNRYLDGENTVQLGEAFGVTSSTIGRILKRNGIERREAGGYFDSVQHAIDGTGRHSYARDCSFYIFDLPDQQGYSKPGISFDVKTRVKLAEGQYGEEHLRITYPTRQEAYFLEQAVLDATPGSAGRPEALLSRIGASEVRALPADDLVLIAIHLADELEELGLWEFAVAYVPMTSSQRAICQQRALADAPAFVTTTG